jgi:hypothetical protein
MDFLYFISYSFGFNGLLSRPLPPPDFNAFDRSKRIAVAVKILIKRQYIPSVGIEKPDKRPKN